VDLETWRRGDLCMHDIAFCALCKPSPYPAVVVVSLGWGNAFHRSDRCIWLRKGQQSVSLKGGQPAPVEHVALQVALGMGRLPCVSCFG